MISLETGATFRGKAGTATAITYTLLGDEINTVAGTDSFKTLAQGQLGTSTATLYTVPGSTQTLIREIHLANTTGSPVTGVTFFVNGSASTNQLNGGLSIPAGGSALFSNNGWVVSDSAGGTTPTTLTLSGDVTGSGNSTIVTTIANDAVTNSRMANVASGTFKGRVTAATGDPEDLTGTQATTLLDTATTSLKGLQSANDKKKEDNLWYDVTANSIATLVGDDATDNTSAWNTFFAGLPVGATVYFPAGTYRTSTGFNISADKHLRILGAGKYTTIIKTTSATGNGFHINGSYWYNSFEDMGFQHLLTGSSVTGGAGININPGASGSAVGTNIYRCSFVGLFVGIRAVGSQAANLSVWDSVDISAASVVANAVPNARGILWNGDTINMVLSNSTINMIYPAPAFSQFPAAGTACMEINQSGAIQMTGGEFIGGTNTLLLNANAGGTTSVAAVYATNCFFDQSNGSTVKIMGANVVNRCKFVQCGITTGNTGATGAIAVEIASSGTGAAGQPTAAADGIDFFDCDIYPNGVTGTTNGFQITGAQGVTINACRISGFTNGITVTPAASNGYTKIFVTNNKLGATNNFTTPNTNGLVLNAGSFQYGAVVVVGNDFTGSTTPLVESASVGFSWQELYDGNIGITGALTLPVSTATQAIASGGTGIITGGSIPVPTNGLRVGNTFRWTIPLQKTGITGTALTFAVKFGTANAFADANVATAAFTGTGAADSGMLTVTLTVLTLSGASTAVATFYMDHAGTTTGLVSTIAGAIVAGTMSTFNAGLTSPYFNVAITANTGTVLNILPPVTGEILR